MDRAHSHNIYIQWFRSAASDDALEHHQMMIEMLEMLWSLQTARHIGFVGHLNLDHPMTACLQHTVIDESGVHGW